jgi:hypothetical protein
MDCANILKMHDVRCSACKLPEEVLAALHDDRLKNGLGFGTLARKYALPERSLSESGVRRHFNRHVAEPEHSPISEGDDVPGADAAPSGTDELDGHAVLESSTRALTEMMDVLVRQHRDVVARNPREAERLLGVFMKVQGQLQRSLKERDQARARQEEFRRAIRPIIKRIASEAIDPIISAMRENGKRVRDDFFEVANQRKTVDEFWSHLSAAEEGWAMEVARRMRTASDAALQAEEEAYARGKKKGREA